MNEITGEVVPWVSADLDVSARDDIKHLVIRSDLPIVKGSFTFLVCDMAAANFIIRSYEAENTRVLIVTDELNLVMKSMYRKPQVKCSVKLIRRDGDKSQVSVSVCLSNGTEVANGIGVFSVLKMEQISNANS